MTPRPIATFASGLPLRQSGKACRLTARNPKTLVIRLNERPDLLAPVVNWNEISSAASQPNSTPREHWSLERQLTSCAKGPAIQSSHRLGG